ncbi:serine hydroxymethyltransferase [Thermomonas sp.]|uniref:serine hydroxymethyltransferase n=1 Tax=Thermomonas sp. TaxID=1971895 RepID=UPI00263950DD|nr:serine hydroxymethyltransferase [Thermomonas sp.]
MYPRDARIEGYDPELAQAIADENRRQEDHVELIASENYASPRVMEAQGSQLTNKYAEGYPGKRYYGGCEFVDVAERLAIERCKQLFGADYANVQPHSGSQANQAVYFALLQPGDTILGMSLAHGGHLTHGAKVNASGKLFNAVQYGVNDQGLIDYDEVERLAQEHRPKMVVAGFSAYSQVVDWARFRAIADRVGAYLFVDMAHVAGLVAAGVYPSPVPHAHVVTSTTHKTLRGPRGGIIVASRAAMGEQAEDIEKKLQSIVFPGIQGGPLMHVIAAKAVAFKEALDPAFKEYQQQVVKNAQAMARTLQARGYKIVSGGTEDHLMLIDLIGREVSGKQAEEALGKAHITVNKNAVPNDPRKPFVTSGLRIGTPAVTTRGYREPDCVALAEWICDVLDNPNDEDVIAGVRENVEKQCRQFPVYG